MPLSRRSFLKSIGLASVAMPFAQSAFGGTARFAPMPGAKRSFELTTRVEIANPKDVTRVWVPAPSQDFGGWFWAHGTTFSGNASDAALKSDPQTGVKFVEANWTGSIEPVLEVTSRFSTRDRDVDPSTAKGKPLSEAERAQFLRPTKLVPLDGIVKQTSDSILAAAKAETELQKVRAIYEWVVDNTYRDGATIGCGPGDIEKMLKTGQMGGKCADINPLFVGLVRAAGIPARDLYGIRVAPSRFGYHSLGANSATVTKAQHCRAEVYVDGVGWMPMDPADVRKVALEEPPGHLPMTSDKVVAARNTLFGAWETNWMPYNGEQDVQLADADGGTLPFLLYPQAMVGGQKLDCYSADAFRYRISAREIEI